MNKNGKILIALVVALLLFTGLQAQALTITFDYQTPSDGSGKTSKLVNTDNTAPAGFYIETFDGIIQGNSAITYEANSSGDTGGFSTLDPTFLDITGGLGIRQGTVSYAATPVGDDTFYAYGPGPSAGTTNATIKVDFTDFIAYDPILYISYLGMYYGSIDDYNNIAFYDDNGLLQTSSDFLIDGILQGSEILDALSGTSGNQLNNASNVYVNLFFEPSEMFTAFEFRTTGIAFEVDNIVSGVSARTPVPEPATILLLGGGLLGLGFLARRQK